MPLHLWLILSAAIFSSTILPGPSVLLCLRNGFIYGKTKSVASALGITSAAMIMGLVSLLGLGTVLKESGVIFTIIKYSGAAYLIYLGIKLWISKTISSDESGINLGNSNGSFFKLYIKALIVGFSNPKAIVFFTALFPQFISKENSSITQFAVILITLGAVVFICMMIYILGGNILSPFLKHKKNILILNKLSGGLFAGYGAAIAVAE